MFSSSNSLLPGLFFFSLSFLLFITWLGFWGTGFLTFILSFFFFLAIIKIITKLFKKYDSLSVSRYLIILPGNHQSGDKVKIMLLLMLKY